MVDLSADYRFDNSGQWIYGLPELTRSKMAAHVALHPRTVKVSNPGCYATAAQVGEFYFQIIC